MYLCGIIGSFNTVVCDHACAELIVWLCRLLWLRSVCPCDMDPATVSSLRDLLPNGGRCPSPMILLSRRTNLFLRWELQSWRSRDRPWRDKLLIPKDYSALTQGPHWEDWAGLVFPSHSFPKVQDSAYGHSHCQDFSQGKDLGRLVRGIGPVAQAGKARHKPLLSSRPFLWKGCVEEE